MATSSIKKLALICSSCKVKIERSDWIKKINSRGTTSALSRSCKTCFDIETSATEWYGETDSRAKRWFIDAIKDEKQHRDIGKVLAYTCEDHVIDMLSKAVNENVIKVAGKPYDCMYYKTMISNDGKRERVIVRFQIKFRMKVWHLETTRRNCPKNSTTNSTGHVAYSNDEFDFLLVFKPGKNFGITGSNVSCIPVSELIHPDKPDQLVTRVPINIKNKYEFTNIADVVAGVNSAS